MEFNVRYVEQVSQLVELLFGLVMLHAYHYHHIVNFKAFSHKKSIGYGS